VLIISGKLLNPNRLFVSFSITKGQVGICDAKQWRGDTKVRGSGDGSPAVWSRGYVPQKLKHFN